MKPCRTHRQSIALYSLNHADAATAERVARHLPECHACQSYLAELRSLQRELQIDEAGGWIRSDPGFEQRLIGKLRDSRPSVVTPWIFWPSLTAVIVLVLVVLRKEVRVEVAPVAPVALVGRSPLSINTYRLAVDASFDTFDRLLSEQGLRSSSPRLGLSDPDI